MTLWTLAHQAPLSMGILQARILEWMTCPPPGDLPNPGIKWSPTLQVDSLPSEPPGKAKNTGVGSLSVLQGIFPTQELNQGLLHCRWILSYQGSPTDLVTLIRFWVCLTFQVLKSQFIILCRIGVRVLLHPSKREEKSPRLCQAPRPTQLTKLPRFEKLTSTAGSVCSAPCFCL